MKLINQVVRCHGVAVNKCKERPKDFLECRKRSARECERQHCGIDSVTAANGGSLGPASAVPPPADAAPFGKPESNQAQPGQNQQSNEPKQDQQRAEFDRKYKNKVFLCQRIKHRRSKQNCIKNLRKRGQSRDPGMMGFLAEMLGESGPAHQPSPVSHQATNSQQHPKKDARVVKLANRYKSMLKNCTRIKSKYRQKSCIRRGERNIQRKTGPLASAVIQEIYRDPVFGSTAQNFQASTQDQTQQTQQQNQPQCRAKHKYALKDRLCQRIRRQASKVRCYSQLKKLIQRKNPECLHEFSNLAH